MCPKSPWKTSRHPNPPRLFPALCASAPSFPARPENRPRPAFQNSLTGQPLQPRHFLISARLPVPRQRGRHLRNHGAYRVHKKRLVHSSNCCIDRILDHHRLLLKTKDGKIASSSAPMMILWRVTTLSEVC